MRLSLPEYSLLVTMAVMLAAAPNSVVAFVPTFQNGHLQQQHLNGKGVSPSTTSTLNYIDGDQFELKSLMDSRATHPAKKAAARLGKNLSNKMSPMVGRLTAFRRRLSPMVESWVALLVSRLSGIVHLVELRAADAMNVIKIVQAVSAKIPIDKEMALTAIMYGAAPEFDAQSATIKVKKVKLNGWSLPTLDRVKDKVKGQIKVVTKAVSPHQLEPSQQAVDAEVVPPTTGKATGNRRSIPFFVRPVTSQSVVKNSQVTDLPSPMESSEQAPCTVHNVVETSSSMEEAVMASREAKSCSPLPLPMDWSQAKTTAVQAMEVSARGAYKVGSMISTATTNVCGSAFTMAREYAAKNVPSKTNLATLGRSPPKVLPSVNVFDLQNILLQHPHEPLSTTSNIDFASIDDVLMQAESALKVVEKLAEVASSSAIAVLEASTTKKESPAPSIGTNMDFSEIDDILMQAESALQLVEASSAVAVPVSIITKKDNKKESPSIGTNMDFSEIDDILMQAESALQLADASSTVAVPFSIITTKEDNKKESPAPSIGTNMDFSDIDDILMQAESALQLADASSAVAVPVSFITTKEDKNTKFTANNVFGIQNILEKLQLEPSTIKGTTFDLDFSSIKIDNRWKQAASSALHIVEELAVAATSKAVQELVSTMKDKKNKKESPPSSSSSSSLGTNMDFSEIDDILMQAESALQLAEGSCM